MTAFQPYISLERYIGRRLLALLAALALADIVILMSVSMSTILSGMIGGMDVVRAMEAVGSGGGATSAAVVIESSGEVEA